MFQNYFKTAFRSLLKTKGFTFLNVAGLSLGLAVFLLILLYVVDEKSYDRYNTQGERIFRINTDVKYAGIPGSFATTGPALAAALKATFPEVEETVRLSTDGGIHFKKGSDKVEEKDVVYSDPSFFRVFTLPLSYGDPGTALAAPNTMVISESAARKYFNRTDVTGQTLNLLEDHDNVTAEKITGVMRDMPLQSQSRYDFILSMASLPSSRDNSFTTLSFLTYILLKPGADYKKLEARFPPFFKRSLTHQPDAWDVDAFERSGNSIALNLSPLTAIHLEPKRMGEFGVHGSSQYISIFSVIALFILLMASINFMNLSTARSASRAREVGVRKVLGSPRLTLIIQFLTESLLLVLGATGMALLLAWTLLPFFNQLSGKELTVTAHTFRWLLPAMSGIILSVGLLAGSYPALFLSGFRPVEVLKAVWTPGSKGARTRGLLVVFQFGISVALIICTLVIYNQLHYMQTKDLGFNRNQVLVIKNLNALTNPAILKQEAMQLPGVQNATMSSFLPVGDRRWPNFISEDASGKYTIQTQFWPIDENYVPTFAMNLVKGRNFSRQFPTDSSAILVNEAAAKMLGYGNAPLEKKLYHHHTRTYHIIGVVKDFNFNSLRDPVAPLVMTMMTPYERKMEGDGPDNLCLRVNTAELPSLMAELARKWKALSPSEPFQYSFMDEDFDALYRTEQRMGELSISFTSLAIIIACLGLFGLAAYSVEQRNNEISIRKILGASIPGLVGMLLKDFLKLVCVAILLALPIAWFLMQKWLQDFAYRVDIHWWVMVLAACCGILIAFITIIFQSLKAARANPLKNLRSE